MYLSVVIPTRNRARRLERALDSLLQQEIEADAFELIVVDNGSTDGTADVCRKFAPRFRNFRYLREDEPGLHVGRHAGLRHARGEVLVFGDDDIRAASSWLAAIRDAFAQSRVGLVGGRILPEFECEPPAWVEHLWARTRWGSTIYQYSVLDFGDDVIEISGLYVYGCNFSIRRQLLQRAGGFHPDAMPRPLLRYRGDGEVAVARAVAQLGYVTLYHPRATVHHLVASERMTRDYLYQRAFAQGVSDSYTAIRADGGLHRRRRATDLARRLAARRRLVFGDRFGIRRASHAGYWDGYTYHRSEVRRDPALLSWVLRPNYLDSLNARIHPP